MMYRSSWRRNPTFFTDANQGRQFVEPHANGNDLIVKSGTLIQVAGRLRKFNADVTVSNIDTGSLALGDDFYIYCIFDGIGLSFIKSKNSTYPTGFNAGNSRKIGGAHLGRYRTQSQTLITDVLATKVLPNSVWDLVHRPACSDPTGMIQVHGGLWADIYLSSENGAAYPDTIPLSRYGATPLTGAEGWSYLDFPALARRAGKRIMRYAEFLQIAEGVPAGSTNAGARILTGGVGFAFPGGTPSTPTYPWVSFLGADQPSGNIWQTCADYFDNYNAGTYVWQDVSAGKSPGVSKGSLYQQSGKQLVAGGNWSYGTVAGARCAYLGTAPWAAASNVGLRCVSDSL